MILSACCCATPSLVDRCVQYKDQITVEVGADLQVATRLAQMLEHHPHLFKKQQAGVDTKTRYPTDPTPKDGTDNASGQDASGKAKPKAKAKTKAKAKAKAGTSDFNLKCHDFPPCMIRARLTSRSTRSCRPWTWPAWLPSRMLLSSGFACVGCHHVGLSQNRGRMFFLLNNPWLDIAGVLDQSSIRCAGACHDHGMRVPRLQTMYIGGLSNIFCRQWSSA